MKFHFTLIGETPLLMHWDNIEGSEIVKAWQKDPANKSRSVAGDDRSPPWTWQTYLYNDGERATMPLENVMGSLLYGGTQVIFKKNKTYKELSQSGLWSPTEHLEFTYGDDQTLDMADVLAMRDDDFAVQVKKCHDLGFRLFAKRARVGQAKHVRVRPRFEQWRVSGEMTVISPDLKWDVIEMIFNFAGRGGLGDWRPSSPRRPGVFGMFRSELKLVK